jgi:hypothetical protein
MAKSFTDSNPPSNGTFVTLKRLCSLTTCLVQPENSRDGNDSKSQANLREVHQSAGGPGARPPYRHMVDRCSAVIRDWAYRHGSAAVAPWFNGNV